MRIMLALWLAFGLCGMAVPALRGGHGKRGAGVTIGLGFQLLAQCRQSLAKTNYFLSPAGLAFALSMVQNGARGETLRQIMAALRLETSRCRVERGQQGFARSPCQNSTRKSNWKSPTRFGSNKGASIKPDFIAVNRRDYEAEVASGDFTGPGDRQEDQ